MSADDTRSPVERKTDAILALAALLGMGDDTNEEDVFRAAAYVLKEGEPKKAKAIRKLLELDADASIADAIVALRKLLGIDRRAADGVLEELKKVTVHRRRAARSIARGSLVIGRAREIRLKTTNTKGGKTMKRKKLNEEEIDAEGVDEETAHEEKIAALAEILGVAPDADAAAMHEALDILLEEEETDTQKEYRVAKSASRAADYLHERRGIRTTATTPKPAKRKATPLTPAGGKVFKTPFGDIALAPREIRYCQEAGADPAVCGQQGEPNEGLPKSR